MARVRLLTEDEVGMKWKLTVIVAGLASACVGACGSSDSKGPTTARATSTATASTSASAPSMSSMAPGQRYLNDGDKDPAGDEDLDDREAGKVDNDNDYPQDHLHPGNALYHDKDDEVEVYGRPASAEDMRAIATLVQRYYAAARTGDSTAACSMMYSVLAEAIPEDYGQPPGPAYLRGKTCNSVLSRLFEHSRSMLTGSYTVTGVRISGNRALVLLGSRTQPASSLFVKRERGVWKIDSLLGQPLT